MRTGLASGGVIVALLAVGAVFIQKPGHSSGQSDKSPMAVETLAIQPADSFELRRTYTGIVKAARTSELSFERTAKLVSILVKEGDRVQQGQVLAQLDVRNLQAKQRELIARKKAAEALFAELKSGPRQQTIEAARAEVEQLTADLNLQTANQRRSERLFRQNAASRADLDRTTFGSKSATSRLLAAKQRLAELEEGTRKERLDAQKAVSGRRSTEISALCTASTSS